MIGIEALVKVNPVTVTLHWPDRWCPACLQETETIADKLYHCPSCDKYTCGRTQIIGATVHAIR